MSGITGILNLDGAPVDPGLLTRMTEFMTFRGPDAQRIWIDGNVGFGHTLLRTTEESEHEQQPFTLDGRVWIVSDARVDAQEDLIAKLAARGEHVERGVTDVELLLRAYRVWGEDCVEHLLGDFAFAVWDGSRRRLFCARDQLGVKPFFYAHSATTLIFSNTLDCIRRHPAVSDNLNDQAIADFLLFDLNQNPATTTFADIQRIPPAHRGTWSDRGIRISRYWTLPIDEPFFFKRATDYIDRFRELLDRAVDDRLRTNKIGIFMSGGLDSPTLAATACKILRSRSSKAAEADVSAFTTVIDGFDGNERYYAGLVAEHLDIPIHFLDRSTKIMDPNWYKTAIHTPEPVSDPTNLAEDHEYFRFISACSRVLFYGEGPDNALKYEWKPYISYLARNRKFGRLAMDVCGHMVRHRRIPLLPTIPRMLKDRARLNKWRTSLPVWLRSDFTSRMQLEKRLELERLSTPCFSHPLRPEAYDSFHIPLWEAVFRAFDASGTAVPLEIRHPFVDLRLLRFMLAVPAIPWCRVKYLERRAMRSMLPARVLGRPKTPLKGDPYWESMRRHGLPLLQPESRLYEYVDVEKIPGEAGTDSNRFGVNFRPFALNYWLKTQQRRPVRCMQEETENEFRTATA